MEAVLRDFGTLPGKDRKRLKRGQMSFGGILKKGF
jgi:hypothetical protein